MNYAIPNFFGIAPKKNPRYLPDGWAQIALNADLTGMSLRGLPALDSVSNSQFQPGTERIYRFGQASSPEPTSDQQYWFEWAKDVDVVRSQLAKDENEWTFYTGDGKPKATYRSIALGAAPYPSASRLLGLPAPSAPCSVTAGTYIAETEPAELVISAAVIAGFSAGDTFVVTVDGGDPFQVTLSGTDMTSVASDFGAIPGVTATVEENAVIVRSASGGEDTTIVIEGGPGSTVWFVSSPVSVEPVSYSEVSFPCGYRVDGDIIYSYVGMYFRLSSTATFKKAHNFDDCTGNPGSNNTVFPTAADIASTINEYRTYVETPPMSIVASTSGDNVVIRAPNSSELEIRITRKRLLGSDCTDISGEIINATPTTTGGGDSGCAVRITAAGIADFDIDRGFNLSYVGDFFPTDHTAESVKAALEQLMTSSATPGRVEVDGGTVVAYFTDASAAQISYQTSSTSTGLALSTSGSTKDPGVKETRVYTYTFVEKIENFEFESAPAEPSEEIDLYYSQPTILSGFASPDSEYPSPTHIRIYRSVSGTYLFVDEIPIGSSYTDEKSPDHLAEEIPSLLWSPPHPELRGITNLPNGIMAGFHGRDIYFCDPYHPHAWPDAYSQSVDYPVVGLGVSDTTLVVLTAGNPYFIQGSHPDSMVVVRADLSQSCVSKESIVSVGGSVLYASPDGLISTNPSESKNVLAEYLSRDDWQSWSPSTLTACVHDNKYYGFTSTHGFVYFLESGQLAMLDFSYHPGMADGGYYRPTALYSDLESDTLFVANGRNLKKLGDSVDKLPIHWKSKKITVPAKTTFAAIQIEAENYDADFPILAKIYADGELIHTKVVIDKRPFRLPATQRRLWEIEITALGDADIFNIAFGQSMSELASV